MLSSNAKLILLRKWDSRFSGGGDDKNLKTEKSIDRCDF